MSTQIGVRKVESTTSHRLTPLTEMAKWISGERIHWTSVANCSWPRVVLETGQP